MSGDRRGRAGARRLGWVGLVGLLLALGLWFRLAVVSSWHASAGDGVDYYTLSQQLQTTGRFAYAPPPAPLTYARLPGYPLLLAYVAAAKAPLSLEEHVRRATRANVPLDLLTALLVFLMLGELGAPRWAALVGLLAVLLCPLLILLSCYALTEPLATCLTTLCLYLLLRGRRRGLLGNAALCGLTAGLGQLVRADALTLWPALLLGFWGTAASRRQRLCALGLLSGVALLVYAPWPVRNLLRFDKPYFAATQGRTRTGQPLPEEVLRWMRTWGSNAPGEGQIDLALAIGRPLPWNDPRFVLPQMSDSDAEGRRLAQLLRAYNREHDSPAVRAGFAALAAERTRRDPVRTYVTLPLRRIAVLWSPAPEWELPMQSRLLQLPARRGWFAVWDGALFALALVGGLALLGPARRAAKTLALLLSVVLGRTLLYAFVIPVAGTQRYLAEIFPVLIVLAGYGLAALGSALGRRLRRPAG